MAHDESRLLQRAIDGRDESVDGSRGQPEEVEVARLSLNVAARDQRGAACKREVLRLGEAGDDRCDLVL